MVDFSKHLKKNNKMSTRDKYKATPLKQLKKRVEEDDAMVGVSSRDYLNLVDGKSLKIRLFPAHEGEDAFYQPHVCYWLSIQKDNGDMGRITVNDATVHGRFKKDICKEYISFAKKKYADDSEKMDLLGDYKKGLAPSYTWICYAKECKADDDSVDIRVWEFKKMVRDAINKLTFNEDDDEAIEVDPFTDVDEGLPLFVKYNSKPNKKKGEEYYEVSLGKKPKPVPLTDEELDKFDTMKKLSEFYPRYSMKDFDRALEGLQNWDEENEFGLFEDDDFLVIVEQVREQFSGDDEEEEKPKKRKTVEKKSKKVVEEPEDDEDEEEEEKPKKVTKSSKKKVEEPEEEEEETDEEEDDSEGDEFDEMDRSELRAYIKENDLDIVVKKSMSEDDIREAIRAASEDSEEETEEEDDEEEEEEKPAPKKGKKAKKEEPEEEDEEEERPKSKVSLSDIRKRLGKK